MCVCLCVCVLYVDGVRHHVLPSYPPPDELVLKVPVGVDSRVMRTGSVSPLMDEWEGQEVREEFHQAWVLSQQTWAQLQQSTLDSSHLTCPALMADIKLVRGHALIWRGGGRH